MMIWRGKAPLVLASRSPQRRAILAQLGVAFDVRPADVNELSAGDPQEVALENAHLIYAWCRSHGQ